MIKKLSFVSHGSLKRFPHTFTTVRYIQLCLKVPAVNPNSLLFFMNAPMNERGRGVRRMCGAARQHSRLTIASSVFIYLLDCLRELD